MAKGVVAMSEGDRRETHLGDAGETIYATAPEPDGEVTVKNVPIPYKRPQVDGQSTFSDWGWSA